MHAQGYNNVSLGLTFFGNKLGNGHPLCPSARELSTLSSSAPLSQHSCLFNLHHIVLFLKKNLFIYYLFLAVLGLRFCARAFSSCGKLGPLLIVMRGPLTISASPVAEHRLQTRRLSSCGSRAQLLRGMWDLPRPGPEPVSPAPAGRLSTTVPPGKPHIVLFDDGPSLEVPFSFGFYDMHFLVLVLLSGLHPCETAEATTDTA